MLVFTEHNILFSLSIQYDPPKIEYIQIHKNEALIILNNLYSKTRLMTTRIYK